LAEIAYSGKYVALDLSACTMTEGTGGEFDPNAANTNGTGKDKIVSLILPDAATKVTGRFNQNFTNLTSVSGEGVETIGSNAFNNCDTLTEVDFPVAKTIENYAFAYCDNLTSVSFPEAEILKYAAFADCYFLVSVDFPKVTTIEGYAFFKSYELNFTSANFPMATTIGSSAFYQCTSLTTADFLGEATDEQEASIGNSAFYGCTSLNTANFTAATRIEAKAFEGCTSLATASFPAVTYINYNVFDGCESLSSVDLRSAESFSHNVFRNTGDTALTVTLGSPAPVLGDAMFSGVSEEKIVTVRVPGGATGYGDIPKTYPNNDTHFENHNWGDGFRGAGLSQSGYFVSFSNCNDSIALHIEYLDDPE
jgi:hypothetical protein